VHLTFKKNDIMKALRKALLILVLAVFTASLTGCFGEFALTRKLYEWNDDVSSEKFVKTLVFYGLNIIPVYSIVGMADIVIFNLIEFWTGSNPISMTEGEHEYQFVEINGSTFQMHASKNMMEISRLNDGNMEHCVTFTFDQNNITAQYSDVEYIVAEIAE
jgi:hypothetical protein